MKLHESVNKSTYRTVIYALLLLSTVLLLTLVTIVSERKNLAGADTISPKQLDLSKLSSTPSSPPLICQNGSWVTIDQAEEVNGDNFEAYARGQGCGEQSE